MMTRIYPDPMALRTAGEITVDVERPVAFAFLQDAARLARCIPGCDDLRQLSPVQYAAVLTSRVAFMTLRFNAIIDVVRIDAPHTIEATITGDAVGLVGHVVATASVQLADEGDRRTAIRYVTDIALTGKLGGIGQPVFRATSARLAREFADNLKTALEAGRAETPA
jgi:carbon monoxide dehydrogenase subunit G